jgi:hypothetical protein
MRSIRSALLMGSVLTMLAGVAFVTVIATGAAIPAPVGVPHVSNEHPEAELGLFRFLRHEGPSQPNARSR